MRLRTPRRFGGLWIISRSLEIRVGLNSMFQRGDGSLEALISPATSLCFWRRGQLSWDHRYSYGILLNINNKVAFDFYWTNGIMLEVLISRFVGDERDYDHYW